MQYNGIGAQGRLLLAENKFNNSKLFYDENKEKLKLLTTEPMRQLSACMAETMLRIDPIMCVDPVKMVSRIRRDTRFSKDKSLYRDNMWTMFMRPKQIWRHQPCMWFEFFPDSYRYGVGMFDSDTAFLELFRKMLNDKPGEFRRAAALCEGVGAHAQIDSFKKSRAGCLNEDLQRFYDAKYLCFMYTGTDMDKLEDNGIIVQLKAAAEAFEPMYSLLLEITEKMLLNV